MSTLHVENLKGLSSGSNANKVIIPTGQTLEVTDNVRYDDMPTGSVIQVVSTMWNTETNTTSINAFVDVAGSSVSFTPKLATSKLIISSSFQFQNYATSGSYSGGMVRTVHDGTALDYTSQNYENYSETTGTSSGNNFHSRSHKMATVSAGNTNARTIKLQLIKYGSGTYHVNVNQGAYFYGVLKVEEIKQ